MSKRNNNKLLMILNKEMRKSLVEVLEATEMNHKNIQGLMKHLRMKRVKSSNLRMRKDFSENNKIKILLQWMYLKDITINFETMQSLTTFLLNNQ